MIENYHAVDSCWQVPVLAMLSPNEVGAMDSFYDEARPIFHWSYHSPYLQASRQ